MLSNISQIKNYFTSNLDISASWIRSSFYWNLTVFCFLGQMGTTGETCWPDGVCGRRNYHVNFPKQFDKKPSVSVSLAGIDVDSNFNVRAFSSAVDVTTSSFDIHYSTWGDTKVYAIKFSWIACAWFQHTIFSYRFWTAYKLTLALYLHTFDYCLRGVSSEVESVRMNLGTKCSKTFWDFHDEFFHFFITLNDFFLLLHY